MKGHEKLRALSISTPNEVIYHRTWCLSHSNLTLAYDPSTCLPYSLTYRRSIFPFIALKWIWLIPTGSFGVLSCSLNLNGANVFIVFVKLMVVSKHTNIRLYKAPKQDPWKHPLLTHFQEMVVSQIFGLLNWSLKYELINFILSVLKL